MTQTKQPPANPARFNLLELRNQEHRFPVCERDKSRLFVVLFSLIEMRRHIYRANAFRFCHSSGDEDKI